jgi:tape measure domain-containing protein
MSETLSDFLIKIGVDTGQSLKRIEKIDKALDRIKGTTGTGKQVSALAAVQKATVAVSKVEQAASRDYLKAANSRLKMQRKLATTTQGSTSYKQQINDALKLHNINTRMERQADIAGVKKINIGTTQARMLNQIAAISRMSNAEGKAAMKALQGQVLNMERSALGVAKMKQMLESALPKQRAFNRELQKGGRLARSMKQSMNNMLRSYISVFAAIQGGRAIVDTTRKFEGMQNGLVAVTGDAETAKVKFDEIKESARSLGVALEPAIDGFVKLTVAGREKFDPSQIKDMHMAMLESATAFGLSADETNGAVKAMAQMMSKGKVTAEEFRGQLAERMPVAFDAMQKALGVTTAEFAEMLDKGKIGLDVLPKFAIELRKVARAGGLLETQQKSLNAGMNRFLLTTQEMTVAFGEAGALEGLKAFFAGMAQGLKNMEPLIRVFGKVAGFALKILGKVFHIFGTILGLIGETLKFIIDNVIALGSVALTGLFGWIVKGKGAKGLMVFTRAAKTLFNVLRAGLMGGAIAFLATNPLGWVLAAATALGVLISEIKNFTADEKDKKVGLFAAPEGYRSALEVLFDGIGDMWYDLILKPFKDISLFGINLFGGGDKDPAATARSDQYFNKIRDYSLPSRGGATEQFSGSLLAGGELLIKVESNNLSPEAETKLVDGVSESFKSAANNAFNSRR